MTATITAAPDPRPSSCSNAAAPLAMSRSLPKSPDTPLLDGRKDFSLIFLHSALDDHGLDPSAFRVYAHLSRRASSGQAFPAVRSIARVCRLHPKTVRAALRALEAGRLILRQERPGRTAIYRLTPKCEWLPKAHACQSDTPPKPIPGTPAKPIQDHPCQTDTHEGNPREGTSSKAIQGESVCADTHAEAWQVLAEYPKTVHGTDLKAAVVQVERAIRQHGFAFVRARTQSYAATYNGEPRSIPSPARWFGGERFLEPTAEWQSRPACFPSLPKENQVGAESNANGNRTHGDGGLAEVPSLAEVLLWAGQAGVDPEWAKGRVSYMTDTHGWMVRGRLVNWRSRFLAWWLEDQEGWLRKSQGRAAACMDDYGRRVGPPPMEKGLPMDPKLVAELAAAMEALDE